ncbi:hypothetical protein JCM10207_001264 [Rhodosporidiobolus poonsookiae]
MLPSTSDDVKADAQGTTLLDVDSPFDRLPDELVVTILHELQQSMKSVSTTAPRSSPSSTTGVILTRLVNLTTLKLQLPPSEHMTDYPDCTLYAELTDPLKYLKNLRKLEIECVGGFIVEDQTFSFGDHVPSLRSVTFSTIACDGIPFLLSDGPPLTSVTLHPVPVPSCPRIKYDYLPWHTIRSLRLRGAIRTGIAQASGLLAAVRGAVAEEGQIPLEHLELSACVLSHLLGNKTSEAETTWVTPPTLLELLQILRSSSNLRSLKFGCGPRIDWPTTPENWASFTSFLASFPSLHTLALWHFDLSNQTDPLEHPAGYLTSLDKLPTLARLVDHLRKESGILRIEWNAPTGWYPAVKVLWSRPSPSDDFHEEVYSSDDLRNAKKDQLIAAGKRDDSSE